MESHNPGPPPRTNGWVQVALLFGAGGFGALLLFTPLSVLFVPGILVVIAVLKVRGGAERTIDDAVAADQQGANATGAGQTKVTIESATTIVASGGLRSSPDEMTEANGEAPPPQPAVAGPSRRTVEMLVSAAAKTPRISATGVLPAPPATTTAATAEANPEAAAPPVVQLTPTRSLVPDSSPPDPMPPIAPAPQTQTPANATDAAAAAPAAPVTGGAAILARLRQQRTDSAKSTTPTPGPAAAAAVVTQTPPLPGAVDAPTPATGTPSAAKPPVTVVYGSQTGTCQEIARNLAAEAVEKGFNASCASLNELGFAAVSPTRTPILIVISSSTGDGDPPDNASAFFVSMRRKHPPGSDVPATPLVGVCYTMLGLGDSNYTRFMYVPRSIKNRLAELGAREFYKCAEADEVEGVENIVEPWTEGLWAALATAVAQIASGVMQVEAVDGPAAVAAVAAAKPAAAPPAVDPAAVAAATAAAAAAQEAAVKQVAAEREAKEAAAAKAAAERAAAEKAAPEKAAAEKAAAEKAAAEKAAVEKAAAEKAAAEKAAAEKAAAEKAAAEKAAAAAAKKKAAAAAAAAAVAAEPLDDLAAAMAALTEALGSTSGPPAAADTAPTAAAATKDAASAATSTAAASAVTEPLLPTGLVSVLEAGAAPSGAAAAAGLPTIKESRVFEEDEVVAGEGARPDPAAAAAAAAAAREDDPLMTPPEEGRPDADGGVAGGAAQRTAEGSRLSLDATRRRRSTEKPPSRLQAKPMSVNFPKREETVVKRKDESTYGMLLGLAPVGVDTKSAPALLPSRIRLQWERDEGRARAVREVEAARPTREECHRLDPEGHYSAAQPFWAHVADARYETAFWSDRKVLHLELSIRGSHIAYEPGDSIGVLPVNHPDLVLNLCKRLAVSPDRVFHVHLATAAGADAGGATASGGGRVASHIPSPVSVGYALSHCVDLTGVARKSVLRLLAEHTADAAEKRTLLFLAAKGGKEAYAHEIGEHQPSLLDLLVRFRTCNPPLEALLDALPPLMPRMYSIAGSRRDPAGGPNRLSVALSVVRFKTRYGTRLGVATTWLDRLAAPFTAENGAPPSEPIFVPIFLRPSADFKPPRDLATPLIMVGPGTGVAPFRGFLQDRRALIVERKPAPGSVGEAVLFFGCRREDEDYLYKEEMEGFKADGTLAALHVAFSRAQADKVYVQGLLRQQGAKVWSLLQAGAHVYVCGDGASMAKDVNVALVGIVQQHGGLSEADAAAYMQNLSQERRYIREVWS